MSDFPVLAKVENEIQKGIVVIRNIRETNSKFIQTRFFWVSSLLSFPLKWRVGRVV
jgi:hypothetical protein